MRTIERVIEYKRGTWLSFYNLADIHAGSSRCDEKKLKNMVEKIKNDDSAYWGLGGDACEWITRNDPRHKESEMAKYLHGVDDVISAQQEWVFEALRPIANKCLWVNAGNHEGSIFKFTERNVYSNIVTFIKQAGGIKDSQQLGIGYRGFVRLRLRRSGHTNTLVIMSEHGWGGGRLKR